MNKLSHSSANIFMTCQKKWEYWYRNKYRPKTTSSALLFGTAVDAGITALLKQVDKFPETVFEEAWKVQKINNILTSVQTSTDVIYSKKDFDYELLSERAKSDICKKYNLSNETLEEECKKVFKEEEYFGSFEKLPEDRKLFYNYINWWSLYEKGLLMIKAVKEDILPDVKEVLGSQIYCELKNEEGDLITGWADAVFRFKDFEKPIIFDFKTSSKDYDEAEAVLTSPQLALYVHSLSDKYDNTRTAGYIVFNKNVVKNRTKVCSICSKNGTGQRHKTCDAEIDGNRCGGTWIETINPKVTTQIIIDEIPERTEDIVLNNFQFINDSINSGTFHRNFNSCYNFGKCVYFNLCFYNNKDNLIQIE